MAEDVVIEAERLGTHTVVRASGYLDVSTSPRLRDRLLEVTGETPPVVLVDLGGIEFLDSSALGVILSAWKHVQAGGGTLVVVSPQPRITKIFQITALDLSIGIYPSLDEARDALGLTA